jgi:hypothetical protein
VVPRRWCLGKLHDNVNLTAGRNSREFLGDLGIRPEPVRCDALAANCRVQGAVGGDAGRKVADCSVGVTFRAVVELPKTATVFSGAGPRVVIREPRGASFLRPPLAGRLDRLLGRVHTITTFWW